MESFLSIRRKELGKTQKEVAEYVGVTEATVSRWESGNIANMRRDKIQKLAEILETTPSQIMNLDKTEDTFNYSQLSPDGYRAGLLYDRATERDRNIVDAVLEPYDDGKIVSFPALEKHIPLISTAMAAGPGEMDTGLPWEDYTVPADSKADFAVRVSGDSMEPVLMDGQIALCREKRPALGDVAIMMVNGSFYVKQFIPDYYGNIYLRSLNRNRKDCDYDIMASGNDTVKCYGTVILPKRPAVVDQ